jgi:hypothetical protein
VGGFSFSPLGLRRCLRNVKRQVKDKIIEQEDTEHTEKNKADVGKRVSNDCLDVDQL